MESVTGFINLQMAKQMKSFLPRLFFLPQHMPRRGEWMGMEAFYRTLDPKKHHMTWSFNPNGLSHIESYYNLKSTSQMIHGTGCRETGRGGAEGGAQMGRQPYGSPMECMGMIWSF